jgi:beta-glucanase (GH16 family)
LEIDIAEFCAGPPGTHDGNDATLLHQIIHGADGGHVASHGTRGVDFSLDWHVYGLDWRADHVTFYLDGTELWSFTDASQIPHVPMAMIVSLAVGGWCGTPDATTPNPLSFQVDWVRVRA